MSVSWVPTSSRSISFVKKLRKSVSLPEVSGSPTAAPSAQTSHPSPCPRLCCPRKRTAAVSSRTFLPSPPREFRDKISCLRQARSKDSKLSPELGRLKKKPIHHAPGAAHRAELPPPICKGPFARAQSLLQLTLIDRSNKCRPTLDQRHFSA